MIIIICLFAYCGVKNMYYVVLLFYYPPANDVAKGYSNATVRPSVTSLWTL
jgi:hypothetical protein